MKYGAIGATTHAVPGGPIQIIYRKNILNMRNRHLLLCHVGNPTYQMLDPTQKNRMQSANAQASQFKTPNPIIQTPVTLILPQAS